MQTKLLLSALATAAICVPACGGSTDNGLVITAASGTATDNNDGTFDIDITASFDDVAPVVSYTLDCSDGVDPSKDFHDEENLSPEVSAGTVTFPTIMGVPATPFDYTCTLQLVDSDGITSALFDFTFNLS